MEAIDTLYRVLKQIKNALKDDRQAKAVKAELIRKENLGNISIALKKCFVDEDWILEFEDKLHYVEQAIEENRHELKKEGGVVRIDQVKKVSADSIKHLAQHSNLITDLSENMAEVIPEKLYVSENSDNYMLYENRFLYTLLIYAKDFVETRYSAVWRTVNDVEKGLELYCNLKTEKKTINLSVNYSEECINDDAAVDSQTRIYISRMDDILETIVALLNRPLMKMAADTAALELPIVATNIIKNNPNFQESYKLFDFITSYSKAGYEIEEKHKTIRELSAESREDIMPVVALLGLITDIEVRDNRMETEREYLEDRAKGISPDDSSLLDEMRRLYEAESRKKEKGFEQKLNALMLSKDAELTAVRAKYNDFASDDHMDEESFKRLTDEKKAFDAYYEKRWSMIKKNMRKEYIWNQLWKKR